MYAGSRSDRLLAASGSRAEAPLNARIEVTNASAKALNEAYARRDRPPSWDKNLHRPIPEV